MSGNSNNSLPAVMRVSDFMLNLVRQLVEERKVTESTANAYVKTMYMLNDKKPFNALTFIKDTEAAERKIAEYADTTQKSIYTSITSVLSLYKDKPTYKRAYNYYYDKMMEKAKDMKGERDTSEKTTKEKDNWIDWKAVCERHKEMGEAVSKFATAKNITAEQFSTLLHWVVLSLYTEVQPRRNQDYLDMFVVKKYTDEMPKDKNYLDLASKQFIFNRFKTMKTYGQQKIAIPEGLMAVIQLYLKHHPMAKGNKKATEFKFLVFPDGTPLTAVNAITRILNRVFGKKIGSSMLRHIFLSSKYDITDMKTDAAAMGHSVSEQKNYLRGSGAATMDEDEDEEMGAGVVAGAGAGQWEMKLGRDVGSIGSPYLVTSEV